MTAAATRRSTSSRQLRQTDNRVNFVNLSRNFGKEIAMLAGFDYTTGDCCVIMDADLQDPPELVDRMLQYWEEGYDDIYAKRRSRGEESWLRRPAVACFLQDSAEHEPDRHPAERR